MVVVVRFMLQGIGRYTFFSKPKPLFSYDDNEYVSCHKYEGEFVHGVRIGRGFETYGTDMMMMMMML